MVSSWERTQERTPIEEEVDSGEGAKGGRRERRGGAMG